MYASRRWLGSRSDGGVDDCYAAVRCAGRACARARRGWSPRRWWAPCPGDLARLRAWCASSSHACCSATISAGDGVASPSAVRRGSSMTSRMSARTGFACVDAERIERPCRDPPFVGYAPAPEMSVLMLRPTRAAESPPERRLTNHYRWRVFVRSLGDAVRRDSCVSAFCLTGVGLDQCSANCHHSVTERKRWVTVPLGRGANWPTASLGTPR